MIAEIKKGAAFDKLAKDKSTDKASGAEGGDRGWFKKSDMVKEFADAAFNLKKGELTETPVKTQFGYHVIKVEDRRKALLLAFEEMADQLKRGDGARGGDRAARPAPVGRQDREIRDGRGKPDPAPAASQPRRRRRPTAREPPAVAPAPQK